MATVITEASEHPKFSGGDIDPPAKKTIDTDAARERITAARSATRASDKAPGKPKAVKDTPPEIRYVSGMYKAPVTALYDQAGRMVSMLIPNIGFAIQSSAVDCGAAWDEVAKQSPAVRAWLQKMSMTGAYGQLFVAHMPILLATMLAFGPQSFRDRVMASMEQAIFSPDENAPAA